MINIPVLSQYSFYTPAECMNIHQQVLDLDNEWVNRGGGILPIFTLGTASYLDASKEDPSVYRNKALKTNPILLKHFSTLYQRLCALLAQILKVPVALDDDLAYPGFHIFLGNKKFEKPVASCHFDLQFLSLQWDKYQKVDFEHPISFTCPFALPKMGSGLNYWEISKQKNNRLSSAEIEALKKNHKTLFFPYSLGSLVLHNGLVLHQIAPTQDISLEDERITLQGHGLFCDGVMRIYW